MPDNMKGDYMSVIIQICKIYFYFNTLTKVEFTICL